MSLRVKKPIFSKNLLSSENVSETFYRKPAQVILLVIAMIWVAEISVAFLFDLLPPISNQWVEECVDATALSLICGLIIWKLILRPLQKFADTQVSFLTSLNKALDSTAMVLVTDSKGKIIYVNESFLKSTGYAESDILNQDIRILNADFQSKDFFVDIWKTITNRRSWHGEIKNRRQDGSTYWMDTSIVPVVQNGGSLVNFISIGYDISQRKHLEESLVRAKQEAEKDLETKARFLANMSHEIRTPMNGIIGMSNLLMDAPLEVAEKEKIKIILNSSQSLLAVINDILDFSKLEAGKFIVEKAAVDLRSSVDDVIQLLQVRASEKGLVLKAHFSEDVPNVIFCDILRVRQILFNLIGNALKFTEHGSVEVNCFARPAGPQRIKLEFAVKDTGIGIPEDVKHKLFQPFSQVDASTTRKFGGSGLGLAICKGLCEKMGGKIWVESQPGIGSIFYFTVLADLSLRQAAPAATAEPVDLRLGIKHPLSILVAEDNEVNQLVITSFLEKLNYKADLAVNGKVVMDLMLRKKYDLILMDCQMPVLDGFETTKLIMSQYSELERPRIVAITASTMDEDIQKCESIGMKGFLGKPISLSALEKVLKETPMRDSDTAVASKKVAA